MDASDLSIPYRRYLAAVSVYHSSVAAAVGLGSSDYQALNLLELTPEGMSVGQLADSTGLTHSAATRMVDRLEAGGYVQRDADQTDRRRSIIRMGTLLPPGLLSALRAVRTHVAPAFTGLDEHDLTVLERYFTSATGGFAQATRELNDTVSRPGAAVS